MGLQLPSCVIMFYQRGHVVSLVTNRRERSNLSSSAEMGTARNVAAKKKKTTFFLYLGHRENERWSFRAAGHTAPVCSPSQNPTASLFFFPPITSELSKRAFADTNRSQTDLVRTLGEQEAHSEASELLNGLSFFLFFFPPCLSDMQIHAARCSKKPKAVEKIWSSSSDNYSWDQVPAD